MIKISVLEININAIKNNIKVIKLKLKTNQKFCLVAKANAYGFGAKIICKNVESLVDCFAVSSADEFYDIITITSKPIMVLSPLYEDLEKLIEMGAELVVSNYESLDKILHVSKKVSAICKVHLAVNTGMNRFGFKRIIDIINVINILRKTQNIVVLGVFSHYYYANNEVIAENQKARLGVIYEKVKLLLPENCLFHLCATDGVQSQNCFDMVRVGMGCYTDKIYKTVTLKSKLIEIQSVEENECVGYGANYIANYKMKVGIVAIGYGDGLMRSIVKNGYVLINKNKAKILAICMDCLIVDITEIDAKIYDDVVLIGRDGDKQIFICDIAAWCDTIEYEIILRITNRVERKYIG